MKATKDDYINQISDIFYEAMLNNTAPWQRPWKADDFRMQAHNPISKLAYKGNNSLLLDTVKIAKGYKSNCWLTFNQIKDLGGIIKKGSKATPIVFYSKVPKNSYKDDEKEQQYTFILKKYSVFNIEQTKDISEENLARFILDAKDFNKKDFLSNEDCERILNSVDLQIISTPSNRAFYLPERDEIHLPLKEQFSNPEAYYSVAFHELGHSTGHQSRLNRDLSGNFGSDSYAKEELRAEIYSFLQAKELGIDYNLENHQSYVKSWVQKFENKKEEIYEAVKDSLKIVDYVKNNYIEISLNKEQKQEKKSTVNELNIDAFIELNKKLESFINTNEVNKTEQKQALQEH